MSATTTISVSNAYGQKGAYVARITGLDKKFGFAREFLVGHSPVIYEPGVYEDCDVNRKGGKEIGYYFVFFCRHGELRKARADKSDVAQFFATGRTIDSIDFIFTASTDDSKKGTWSFDITKHKDTLGALREERDKLLKRLADIDAVLMGDAK